MTIELNNVSSGYSTGVINDNFQALETYINEKLLNRDGTEVGEANQMELPLDMNSHPILNATTDTSDSGSLITVGEGDVRYVNTEGDTMTGPLNMGGNGISGLSAPTHENQAARLKDVQNALAGGSANLISFVPYGNISSENLQGAVEELTDGTGQSITTSSGQQTLIDALSSRGVWVSSVTALKALTSSTLLPNQSVTVTTTGRAGSFTWMAGDRSANVTADPQEGVWVAPNDDATGALGAWMRQYNGITSSVSAQWFGATGSGDSSVAIQAAYDYSPKVHFPALPSGQRYLMDSSDLVLATTTNERQDALLSGDGKGSGGEWVSSILFGSGFGVKINGANGNYVLRNLVTKDLFFGPKDSASRTTPIFDATGLLYWERQNCHFQGDTLKEQPVIRLRWSLGITSRSCNVFGGATGQDLGTVGDPVNQYECVSDNLNGSRRAIDGACTTFKMLGGLVQSCGDGLFISSNGKNESSSSVIIQGVYFENNKFHDGTSFTGRDITLGSDGFVRALDVSGNYHAQLDGDNAFTSGQGKSNLPPVKITKVIGGGIRDNFWTNGGLSKYCELGHFNSSGTRFPKNIEVTNNTDLFTFGTASCVWAPNVVESQKLALFDDDSIVIRDAVEKEIGKSKKIVSSVFRVSTSGTIHTALLDTEHYGDIKSIKLLCSDGVDLNATLSVGILASSTFYVNTYQVGQKASYTTTALPLNNTKIAAGGGPVVAELNVTTVTSGGTFSLEVEYVDVLQ